MRLKDSLTLILFVPIFVLALVIMLPVLVYERVPVKRWLSAVMYWLFVSGRR